MSKIVRFHEYGNADVLKLDEVEDKKLGSHEVLIKVAAIGLNRAEVAFREGNYLERPKALPSRLGYEASGTIESIGNQVTKFKIGDKVSTIPAFSMGDYGVYGETAVVPDYAAALYPQILTVEEAASIWMQYITAYGALVEHSKIGAGDFVLIPAASSSVGIAAIQLCNACGAVPIATTRTSDKVHDLLEAGAVHVIATKEEDLVKKVLDVTNGKGATVIFDPVAGSALETHARAAAHGATIYVYGALSAEVTPYPLFECLKKALKIQGYTLFEITNDEDKRQRAETYIFDALSSGKLKPKIDSVFTLDQIGDAHRYMESNKQNGKIVVTTGSRN